jgi:hypothetical protein
LTLLSIAVILVIVLYNLRPIIYLRIVYKEYRGDWLKVLVYIRRGLKELRRDCLKVLV